MKLDKRAMKHFRYHHCLLKSFHINVSFVIYYSAERFSSIYKKAVEDYLLLHTYKTYFNYSFVETDTFM